MAASMRLPQTNVTAPIRDRYFRVVNMLRRSQKVKYR